MLSLAETLVDLVGAALKRWTALLWTGGILRAGDFVNGVLRSNRGDGLSLTRVGAHVCMRGCAGMCVRARKGGYPGGGPINKQPLSRSDCPPYTR